MAISTQDLLAPFDPTAYVNITGAQLLQLITGATPNTNVGFCLTTDDIAGNPVVPNASITTKWQSYLWIRASATFVTVYVWNPNGATDATYLNWVTVSSASIGPGTIQGYQIATSTIPATAIISISSAQITGNVVPAWLAGLNVGNTAYATNGLMNNNSLIFGCLNGVGSTVATPIMGNAVILLANMAVQSVAGNATALLGNIVDNSITKIQLLGNGAVDYPLQLVGAVDPFINISIPVKSLVGTPTNTNYNPTASGVAAAPGDVLALNASVASSSIPAQWTAMRKAILTLVEPSNPAANQAPMVVNGQSAYSLGSINGANGGNPFGRILQQVLITDTTPLSATYASTSATYTSDQTAGPSTTRPAYNAAPSFGTNAAGVSTNTVAAATNLISTFIPLSSASTIVVELDMQLGTTGTNYPVIAALFMNCAATATNCVAATSGMIYGPSYMTNVRVIYKVIPGAVTPIVFQACYGTLSGTAMYNTVTANTVASFGGTSISSMKITEYL